MGKYEKWYQMGNAIFPLLIHLKHVSGLLIVLLYPFIYSHCIR